MEFPLWDLIRAIPEHPELQAETPTTLIDNKKAQAAYQQWVRRQGDLSSGRAKDVDQRIAF